MNKKLNYKDLAKEALILTGADAIVAAAVYFFLVPAMRPSAAFRVLALCCPILYRSHCPPLR